ncbi:unnamed protein product [Sordaria macrospora k-hell]|uniref:WGS project CABT00000000 data, contig 2.237 n=1 Tax=Sordaria macrospora (strain ATCC MYA-333 / DSM 997 / K(L3346) / K-hell) TaxID=771870 RepID=F7WCS9_SORMK|nr:uncharacterized protein SMAC_09840 [Sordaria macrospora k-hell]CCC05697.1 unnamed protein product [Sordaria macrospora k-hell]
MFSAIHLFTYPTSTSGKTYLVRYGPITFPVTWSESYLEVIADIDAHYFATQGPLQDDEDDGDSTIGSDAASSTASISSSILHYRTLNGRTYHSDSVTDGEYCHHAMTVCLDGTLYNAPLPEKIENAIDLGTGTGTPTLCTVLATVSSNTNSRRHSGLWAIDFADKFPNCTVMGTDISPIQPGWVPPNIRFEIDDYNKEWIYKSGFFDYVHLRWLACTVKDWPAFYREAYRVCKPGGYIEHMDLNGVTECDDSSLDGAVRAMHQWGPMWHAAGRKVGYEVDMLSNNFIENGMKEAGFVNTVVKDYKVPLSPWSTDPKLKELGLFFRAAIFQDLEGSLQFMWGKMMGWTPEMIRSYAQHFTSELRNMDLHPYFVFRVVYGQKPLDA